MTLLTWIGILLCLTQSAMFSGLNLGLFSLSKLELEVEADMRLKYDQQLKDLREQRQRAEERLKEMQQAGEASWKRMREGMESAWDEMARAFRDASDRFRG